MARAILTGVVTGSDKPLKVYWDQVRVVEVDVIGTDDVFYARITKATAQRLLDQGQGQLEARISEATFKAVSLVYGYEVVIGHRI